MSTDDDDPPGTICATVLPPGVVGGMCGGANCSGRSAAQNEPWGTARLPPEHPVGTAGFAADERAGGLDITRVEVKVDELARKQEVKRAVDRAKVLIAATAPRYDTALMVVDPSYFVSADVEAIIVETAQRRFPGEDVGDAAGLLVGGAHGFHPDMMAAARHATSRLTGWDFTTGQAAKGIRILGLHRTALMGTFLPGNVPQLIPSSSATPAAAPELTRSALVPLGAPGSVINASDAEVSAVLLNGLLHELPGWIADAAKQRVSDVLGTGAARDASRHVGVCVARALAEVASTDGLATLLAARARGPVQRGQLINLAFGALMSTASVDVLLAMHPEMRTFAVPELTKVENLRLVGRKVAAPAAKSPAPSPAGKAAAGAASQHKGILKKGVEFAAAASPGRRARADSVASADSVTSSASAPYNYAYPGLLSSSVAAARKLEAEGHEMRHGVEKGAGKPCVALSDVYPTWVVGDDDCSFHGPVGTHSSKDCKVLGERDSASTRGTPTGQRPRGGGRRRGAKGGRVE